MKWIGLIALFWCGSVKAQFFTDAAGTALAGADLYSIRNGFIDHNPAAISQFTESRIGISQYIPYSIPELAGNSVYLITRFRKQPFGIDYSKSGIDGYSENRLAFTAGRKLSDKINLGIKIRYVHFTDHTYTTKQDFIPEIGIIYRWNNKLSWGSHLIHSGTNINDLHKAKLRTGIRYYITSYLPVFILTEIDEASAYQIKIASEYQINKRFSFRSSFNSTQPYLAFGLAYFHERINIEASSGYHTYLGFSPCITLNYAFKKAY